MYADEQSNNRGSKVVSFSLVVLCCVFVGFPLKIYRAEGKDFIGKKWRGKPVVPQFEAEKTRATYLFLPSRLWLFCRAERRRWCWLCSSDTRAVCSLISSLVLRWCFRTSSFISLYCFLCSRTKPFCCFNSSTVWASNSKDRGWRTNSFKSCIGVMNITTKLSHYI